MEHERTEISRGCRSRRGHSKWETSTGSERQKVWVHAVIREMEN